MRAAQVLRLDVSCGAHAVGDALAGVVVDPDDHLAGPPAGARERVEQRALDRAAAALGLQDDGVGARQDLLLATVTKCTYSMK